MEKSQRSYAEFVADTKKILDKKLENGEIDLVQYEDCISCLETDNCGKGGAGSESSLSTDKASIINGDCDSRMLGQAPDKKGTLFRGLLN